MSVCVNSKADLEVGLSLGSWSCLHVGLAALLYRASALTKCSQIVATRHISRDTSVLEAVRCAPFQSSLQSRASLGRAVLK